MPPSALDLVDLVDLKMLPAWVNEPAELKRYPDEDKPDRKRPESPRRHRNRKRPASDVQPEGVRGHGERPAPKLRRDSATLRERDRRVRRPQDRYREPGRQPARAEDRQKLVASAPAIEVRFLPHLAALESVIAQIKEGSVAYSLFALARLFLEKPTRHDVRLKAPSESTLWQLGEDGVLSVDRRFLERNAFRFAQADFYKIDVTEGEPIKGNFTNVARCRLSGTLLGPTNHHDYQRRLRTLYEQRFSRRMSFADYQRQVEIVTDPALVDRWKEEARKITSFTALREDQSATFSSAAEAERDFRRNYLPTLVRNVSETSVSGVESRRLPDRVLHHVVEREWAHETRSPSRMMQELAVQFRQGGLHVFRHRRGMLFVSPIYPRAFAHDGETISPHVRSILDSIAATPRIGRKELADRVVVRPGEPIPGRIDLPAEETERAKLALAADLRWLISEGYVIEFNDGSLDLPRIKAQPKQKLEATLSTAEKEEPVATAVSAAEVGSTESRSPEETEIGGS